MNGGFRLSPQQRRLWRLAEELGWHLLEGRLLVAFPPTVPAATIRRAVDDTVARWEILRTRLVVPPGLQLPVQQVGDGPPLWVPPVTLAASPTERPEAVDQLLDDLAARVAEPAGPPLAAGLATAPDTTYLALGVSALVADRRTLHVLAEEIARAVAAPGQDGDPGDEELLQYADLSQWLNELLDGEESAEGVEHWSGWRSDGARALELPWAAPSAAALAAALERESVTVEPAALDRLDTLARRWDLGTEALVLAVWEELLARLTGAQRPSLGMRVDGRSYEGLESALGPFERVVPLDGRSVEAGSLATAALDAGRRLDELAGWQEFFHWEMAAGGRRETPLDGTVFRAGFALRDRPQPPTTPDGPRLLVAEARQDLAELTLEMERGAEGPVGLVLVGSGSRGAELRVLGHAFARLLEAAVEAPEMALAELALVASEEDPQGARAAGETLAADPEPVHRRFEVQAQRVPGRTAVAHGERSLTYGALEVASRRLAGDLLARGIGPGATVGVVAERSLEMVVALLGVLRSGAAYVPVEPSLPAERQREIAADAAVAALVAALPFAPGAEALALEAPLLVLDDPTTAAPDGAPEPAALPAVDPAHLAYVLFTSGSTGRPKGVAVEHRQLAAYTAGIERRLELPDGATYLLLSTFAADLGNTVLFPALAGGGTLVVATAAEASSARALAERLSVRPVDCAKIAPSHLEALWAGGEGPEILPRHTLVLGGEATRARWAEELLEAAPGLRLVNHYGPTETTVGVLTWSVGEPGGEAAGGRPALAPGTLPLERPLPAVRVTLRDPAGRPVPTLFPGEITVGGDQVARGYVGRPAATAAVFVPDPAGSEPGGRVYRTGDLARRGTDGTFQFLGRIDSQVKVRGFRLELGEVEAALALHPRVRQAAVALVTDPAGDDRLAAWVVAESDQAGGDGPDPASLRDHLAERLPDFALPAVFVPVERLPRTASGKVDRRALPAPDWNRLGADRPHEEPQGELERTLAGLWADVLGLERVSRHDHFFHVGGDSIRAIVVRSRAEERGLALSIEQIFATPTVAQLAAALEQGGTAGALADAMPRVEPFALVDPDERRRLPEGLDDAYPLSHLQAGMLFHSAFGDEASAYHDLHSFHLRAPWAPALLRRALAEATAAHPALRTSFEVGRYAEPLQLVHSQVEPRLEIHDLRAVEPAEQERRIAAWLDAERRRAFDWSRPPLVGFHLHRRTDESFQLTVSFHHAILDGWSTATLLADLFRRYVALVAAPETAPPPADAPVATYADFVALERRAAAAADSTAFWRRHLDGAPRRPLPRWPRPDDTPATGAGHLVLPVAADVAAGLHRLAEAAGTPVKSVLLAAHLQVLAHHLGSDDVVTGLVVNGRPESAGGERMLGLFLNTVPLRLRFDQHDGGTWRQLVAAVFDLERQLLPHRRVPSVQGDEPRDRRAAGGLFDTAFNFLHFHVYQGLDEISAVELLERYDYEETALALGATFALDLEGEGLRLRLEHAWDQVGRPQVESVGETYLRVLGEMARRPDSPRAALDPLGAAGRRRLLEEWSRGEATAADGDSLPAVFARRVARGGDGAALVAGDGEVWSWRRLGERVTALAQGLEARGVGPEVRVGLVLDRSPELVVAMLAVLEAGGVFVPSAAALPRRRIEWILDDAGVALVVAGDEHVGWLGADGRWGEPVTVAAGSDDGTDDGTVPGAGRAPTGRLLDPAAAAYVLYTSGSTGAPRGVVVSHRGIVPMARGQATAFELGAGDRLMVQASPSFDAFVGEVATGMVAGAVLHLVPAELEPGPALGRWMAERAITHGVLTPSAAAVLPDEPLDALRMLALVGETPQPSVLERRRRPGRLLIDAYGPTEATVCATAGPLDEAAGAGAPVSIGRPLEGVESLVLDRRLEPVPVGTPGELCLGGPGLARGYLGRPGATAAAFVPHPHGAAGARLYRTGDLARWLPDGRLELAGRIDHQVQVRGVRVELAEVEAAVAALDGVAVAVASLVGDGEHGRLAVHLVAEPGTAEEALRPSVLRAALAETLPGTFIPTLWQVVDELPRTASGKLDRRRLPPLEAPAESPAEPADRPRTPVERILVEVWQQVLGRRPVGIHDNYFDLGGDSILSIQITTRAERLGVSLSPRHLFEHQTVARLAQVAQEGARRGSGDQRALVGEVAATPIQRWFFDTQDAGRDQYNQTVLVELTRPVAPGVLARAVERLVAHHDGLRCRFPDTGDGPAPTVAPASTARPATVVDLTALGADARRRAIEAAAPRVQGSLDLERGPVERAVVFAHGPDGPDAPDAPDAAAGGHRLLWAVHHLVVDAVSWRILLEDLLLVVDALEGGAEPVLPLKSWSVGQWAEALVERAGSPELAAELAFWTGLPWQRVAPVPRDRRSGDGPGLFGTEESVEILLDEESTRALVETLPAETGSRPQESLLAGLALACRDWTGSPVVAVEVEGHGRRDPGVAADLARTVGWFTSTHPLVLDLAGAEAPREVLDRVAEQIRAVPDDGFGHGLLRRLSDHRRRLAELPEPEIGFNYLGRLDRMLPERVPLRAGREAVGRGRDPRTARPQLLSVNCGVVGGRLRAVLAYSTDHHDRATVEGFAADLARHLERLLGAAGNDRPQGYSPSDFPLAGLGEGELEQIVRLRQKKGISS